MFCRHDISVLIIKVAVLMHEHVHSCLHLSIVNKMLFDIYFINYVYLYFIYNLYVLIMNPLPKKLSPSLHSLNPIRSGGGGALKAPPLRFFALTHLILELHYCALVTFPKK